MILTEDECFAALSDDITAIEETRACEEEWAVIVAMCRAIESAVIAKLAVSQNALKDEIRLIWKPKCAALRQQLEAAQAENAQWRVDFKEMVIERNAALARLAEIKSTHIDEVMNGLIMLEKSLANLKAQEPVGTVDRTAPGFVAWVGIPKLKDGSKLFASAGAAPVQPSQEWKPALSPATISTAPAYLNTNDKAMWALGWNECLNAQPPAPSDAAREYMTGYSDGREWAKPSQALELSADDVRAAGGIVHSDGIIFFTNIGKLNAAINAKERAAHDIKQGGQHD